MLLVLCSLLNACERAPAAAPVAPSALDVLRPLTLQRLQPPPPDPSNRYAADPRAAHLGERLFFDTRLSRNGEIACASCHQSARHFGDDQPHSQGLALSARHTPGLEAAAQARWLFWDGRADSLWAQALGPLEDAREQGLSRVQLARLVARHYREDYRALFGPLPALDDARRFPISAGPRADTAGRRAWTRMRPADREAATAVAVNVGKAIAAYERQLRPAPARFDAYVEALARGGRPTALSAAEQHGLDVFIGKGQCLRCHSGPLFSNQGFHNTGLASALDAAADRGRAAGLDAILQDELSCAGPYNDAPTRDCPHLRYARAGAPEWLGAFKVPSLRNVARTAPYMHDGRFRTLDEVVAHYDRAANPDGVYGHTELLPLGLTAQEKQDLVAFLGSLTAVQ